VPGQAHLAVPRLLSFAAAVYLAVVLPAFGRSTPSPLGRASALRLQNAHLEAQSRSAVLGLYSLDVQLAAARVRLSALQGEQQRLRAQRATLRQELRIARLGEQLSEQQLASRLRQLYDQGDVSPLEVMFAAGSLSDAMTQLDNMHRVASLNDEMLAQLRSARTKFLTTARTLAVRTSRLDAAVRAAAATEASLVRTRAARAGYITKLGSRRSLNAAQIARLEAEARAAEQRSQQLTRGQPATLVSTRFVATAPRTFTRSRSLSVTISGYALSGRTATGIPVGWGVAAVDPRVIPLGTHIWVPGYGEAVAADVGGSIVGARVDLWFPTVSQADSWGLRTLTIALH
jgi:3D (Asp-Asp-Asp) domain-containing protein